MRRPFHYHQSLIADHLSTPTAKDLEDPSGLPCFSLITLSRKRGPRQELPHATPDLIDGEKEYEIEKIIRHRRTPSTRSFLIQWKGYSTEEDSWVPERDLKHAKSTLTAYKKLHPSVFRS